MAAPQIRHVCNEMFFPLTLVVERIMKRSIKQLASFAAIGALSLSASICVAAGETGINTHSADSMTTWYGNAGGPVPPVSLSTPATRGQGAIRYPWTV